MKILKQKKQKLYVWKNVHLNLSRLIIFLILFIFCIILFATGEYLFNTIGLLLIPVLYLLGLFSYKKYETWFKGDEGEKIVIRELEPLEDNYYLINGIVLPGSRGDIDHIVIGPNGIFVIEAKNYSGEIFCIGDKWERQKTGRKGTVYDIKIGSPSNQVKRNAKMLKDLLIKNKREIFKRYSPHLWVHGIVVFTNPSCELKIRNKTVLVLRLKELYKFIKNTKSDALFPDDELKRMGKVILKYGR